MPPKHMHAQAVCKRDEIENEGYGKGLRRTNLTQNPEKN